MRKIVFLSVFVGLMCIESVSVNAAKRNDTHSCGAVVLTYNMNSSSVHYDDDEFLYENDLQHNLSQQGYTNSKNQNSGSGIGYECDSRRTSSCTTDDFVELEAGHWFNGDKVNEKKTYICRTHGIGNDYWEVYTKKNTCAARGITWEVGTSLPEYQPTEWCSGFEHSEDFSLVKTWEVKCLSEHKFVCFAHECIEGYSADSNGKCVGGNINPDPNPNPDPKLGFCGQLEKLGATRERLKCCRAGSDTKWVDVNGVEVKNSLGKAGEKCVCKDSTKTWNSAKGICEGQNVIGGNCDKYLGDVDAYKCCSGQSNGVSYWDEVNKKCHCLKTGEEWDYNQHMCLKKNSTGDEKECRYRFHGEFKCANGTRIRRDYEFILSKEDLKNMTCEKFQERYRNDARGIESLFQKLCLDSQNTEQIPLDAATKRAISNINSFFDMSESNRNVWRDEEGQFNTARLASDATAGVVLGTVGGIVSAKIIKKKQLEKGFDVLHCTVGGQKMADYGDTFQVSYQR